MTNNTYYKKVAFLFSISTFLILLFLVLFDLKTFHLWYQVTYLFESDFPLSKFLIHPHGPRYLLTYPVFYVSSLTDVDRDLVFSIVISFLIAVTVHINLMSSYFFFNKKGTNVFIFGFIVFLFYMTMSLFMNGRILFAMLGSSLFVNLSIYRHRGVKFYALAFISIFLACVSSGTVTIVLIWSISYYLFFYKKSIMENILGSMTVLLFIYLISSFFMLYLNKNLDSFGGSFYQMMKHGLGAFIHGDILLLILKLLNLSVFLAVIFVLESCRGKLINDAISWMLYMFFSIALAIGVFGISSATMVFPVMLIILVRRFSKYFYAPKTLKILIKNH